MKFVALISGGKDSFFNIMHCMQNGHTLVACANLHPGDPAVSELDSFMFQTVGHDVIELYAQCLSVPLYRVPISGTSANVALEYFPTQQDEIEDLYALLEKVKKHHPDVEGVSCGAILSHYQRTRVENVCERLGLTSLSYLWQRNQLELMLDMCELGLDARLIKVAAIGLTEKHLGKLILEMYPILCKLNMMYDVHVCGEGGEFETLVFDAPFFEKRLQVVKLETVAHSQDALYLKVEAEVCEKLEKDDVKVNAPPLLEEQFQEVLQVSQEGLEGTETETETRVSKLQSSPAFTVKPNVFSINTRLYVSNLVSSAGTLEEQTHDVMSQLGHCLASNNSDFSHVQHMTVLMQDMAHFARINAVYSTFFKDLYLPPSRVCVETTLAAPHLVQVSCVVMKPKVEKIGIHIRSRSYWAPQNIGPYSQAIVEQRPNFKTATLSGQIPLVPSTMEIDPHASLLDSAVLSLQHLYRAKLLVNVRKLASCACYVTEQSSVPIVAEVWRNYVEEVENGQDFHFRLLILQTTGLPRGANVEWSGLAYEKIVGMYDDDDESEPVAGPQQELSKAFAATSVAVGDGYVSSAVGGDFQALIDFLRNPMLRSSYVSVMTDLEHIHELSYMGLCAEWTPVLGVWDSTGTKHAFGVIWIN